MEYNTELFKSNLYVISYRGENLGKIHEAPRLSFNPGLYAARNSFVDGKKFRNIIATTNIKVTIKFKTVDANKNFIRINIPTRENGILSISRKLLDTGGKLYFYPCSNKYGKTKNICFPKAVLLPDKYCIYKHQNDRESYFELTFEVYENPQGILIQEYFI
jgi:hypothetical protein